MTVGHWVSRNIRLSSRKAQEDSLSQVKELADSSNPKCYDNKLQNELKVPFVMLCCITSMYLKDASSGMNMPNWNCACFFAGVICHPFTSHKSFCYSVELFNILNWGLLYILPPSLLPNKHKRTLNGGQEFCLVLDKATTQKYVLNYLRKCCVKENDHRLKLSCLLAN